MLTPDPSNFHIELVDRITDQVIANGFVFKGNGYVEPDYTGAALFEEMVHVHPSQRDESYNQIFDSYIDHIQSLSLLAFTAAEANLESNGLKLDTASRFEIARQVGGFICRRQVIMGILNIKYWLDLYKGEQPRPLEEALRAGEIVNKGFDLRFALDKRLARLRGTSFEQSPSELMSWHLNLSMAAFLQKCDNLINDLHQ